MNRRRREGTRLAAPALSLALLLVLTTACGGGEDGAGPRRWVLANVHPAGYPTAGGLEAFAGEVAADERLAGRVEIDLQLAGVLGNEKETLEKLRFGGLQMICTSAAPLSEFAPAIGVLSLPYLFRDAEHLWAVLGGEIGGELSAALAGAGFVPLAWYDAGARSFYNRRRPVRRLADLEGLKIRVQRSEVMRDTVAALGAAPVALGFKQVYTSLHTGAIDGAENNLPSYRSERHFETAPYYSRDRHSMIPDVLMVSTAAWESLTPDQRTALREAAERSAKRQRELWAAYVAEAERFVTAAGSEILEIEDPEAFRRAVEPVYRRHAARFGDLPRRIRAVD